ncbi:alpha/beta hydrolase family protein [Mucilaginibacter lacusdianchii]|uniref:alpha/beta hydrolase family protein n=1 Tax=Mucilaginibacter lacusdianchii TaxID=2684211 RepID=UPI00131B5D57|nr:alpha/beta fold hydrolase [Mucilaginibacter sp. JXJ CY 39]
MITITHPDGAQNKAAILTSANATITFILLPAMGVKATFYKRFAENLCKSGFNVISADWRGIGSSTMRASRNINFGYQQLIDDIKDLVSLTESQFPNTNKFIIGHSLGGQLGSLFASRFNDAISGLILMTTCSVYYKVWQGWDKLRVLWAGLTFYPVSYLLGYFPGNKVGFGDREARTVMKDWCRNALTGSYRLTACDFDYDTALSNLQMPVLAFSVENDKLASKSSVLDFLKKLHPDTPVKHFHLLANDIGIAPLNHFSWAKKSDVVVLMIKDWLTGLSC